MIEQIEQGAVLVNLLKYGPNHLKMGITLKFNNLKSIQSNLT